MIVPSDLTNFIEPEPVKSNSTNTTARNLADYAIKVTLFPEEGNQGDIGYTGASLVSFTPEALKIQLHFDDPIYVSSTGVSDKVEIKILDQSKFMSPEGKLLDQSFMEMTEPIPRQLSEDAIVVDVQGAAKSTLVVMLGSTVMTHPIF